MNSPLIWKIVLKLDWSREEHLLLLPQQHSQSHEKDVSSRTCQLNTFRIGLKWNGLSKCNNRICVSPSLLSRSPSDGIPFGYDSIRWLLPMRQHIDSVHNEWNNKMGIIKEKPSNAENWNAQSPKAWYIMCKHRHRFLLTCLMHPCLLIIYTDDLLNGKWTTGHQTLLHTHICVPFSWQSEQYADCLYDLITRKGHVSEMLISQKQDVVLCCVECK